MSERATEHRAANYARLVRGLDDEQLADLDAAEERIRIDERHRITRAVVDLPRQFAGADDLILLSAVLAGIWPEGTTDA